MKPAFLAVLMIAAGCDRNPSYQSFSDASGVFTAQVPTNWPRDGQDDLSRKPAAFMTWTGAVAAESEGYQIGAVINVSRLQRKDVPAKFKKETIDPTDAIFGSGPLPPDAPALVTPATISGKPARRYRRDFETMLGGGMHAVKGPFPMRLEDVVVQTPDAYYVLEYRATQDLFDKHYPVFQRFVESFRLSK